MDGFCGPWMHIIVSLCMRRTRSSFPLLGGRIIIVFFVCLMVIRMAQESSQKLLKGIYHNHPPKPRYAFIWDSDKVIHYLATLNTDDLDFKMLSYKCVTLLTLLSGQRVSTLHKFKCSSLQLTDRLAQFQVVDLLKHYTPHHKQQPVLFSSYPYILNLCPISQYLIVRGKLQAPH